MKRQNDLPWPGFSEQDQVEKPDTYRTATADATTIIVNLSVIADTLAAVQAYE
jgi:hypothetical protein